MTEIEQKERDFAIAWCGSKSKDYNFTPDMLLAFAKEYNQLKQGSKLPMHDVSGEKKNSEFLKELKDLLIKYNAEICLEDVDNPINPWSNEHTIVVNFNWGEDEKEPTHSLEIGMFEDGK